MIGLTILILLLMEQPLFCNEKDYIIWNGNGSHMSQHFMDPYSITHMLHGLILYNLLHYLKIKENINYVISIMLACAWEIVENTPLIIDIYRQEATHNGYYGDSVINSIGDILSCVWMECI